MRTRWFGLALGSATALQLVAASTAAFAAPRAPAVSPAASPSPGTSPSPTTSASPAASPSPASSPGNAAANPASLQALAQRLDALQQQNAAQQAELDRLRAQIASLQPASATGSPTSTGTSVAVAQPPAPAQPTPTIKKAPTQQSVESVYQQQNAAFNRRLTVTPSLTQTYSDNRYFTLNGFLALGAIFLGNIDVTQQRSSVSIFQADATYGINDRLQLEAIVPYYNRSSTFTSVGANFSGKLPAEDTSRSHGIGDVEVGGYYALKRETPSSPSVTLNAHASLPTGRAPYGIKLITDPSNDSLQYPSSLPTGSGVLGYEFGASFVKTSDPAIFFGGANYYLESSKHFSDLSFDPNVVAPGLALPGNAIQYQLGTAFALNEKTSLSFSFVDAITNDTQLHPDGGVVSTVVASGTNAAVLDVSAGFASNPRQTLVTDLQIGLTKDAPNFQLGLRVPTRF